MWHEIKWFFTKWKERRAYKRFVKQLRADIDECPINLRRVPGGHTRLAISFRGFKQVRMFNAVEYTLEEGTEMLRRDAAERFVARYRNRVEPVRHKDGRTVQPWDYQLALDV